MSSADAGTAEDKAGYTGNGRRIAAMLASITVLPKKWTGADAQHRRTAGRGGRPNPDADRIKRELEVVARKGTPGKAE